MALAGFKRLSNRSFSLHCAPRKISFLATVERLNPQLARRFVFITGLDDEGPFQKFIDAVALPTLHKPVNLGTLMNEVLGVMDKRSTADKKIPDRL